MAVNKTYYEFLEILPTASEEIVRAAVNVKLKKYHPDHGGTDNAVRVVIRAKETLLDPARRRAYDEHVRQRLAQGANHRAKPYQQTASAHTTWAQPVRTKQPPSRSGLYWLPDEKGIGFYQYTNDRRLYMKSFGGKYVAYPPCELRPFSIHEEPPPLSSAEGRTIAERVKGWTKLGYLHNFTYAIWSAMPGALTTKTFCFVVLGVSIGWFAFPLAGFLRYLEWRRGFPFGHQLAHDVVENI